MMLNYHIHKDYDSMFAGAGHWSILLIQDGADCLMGANVDFFAQQKFAVKRNKNDRLCYCNRLYPQTLLDEIINQIKQQN
jgi:hypothetical protein